MDCEMIEEIARAAERAAREMRGGYAGSIEHAVADGLDALARELRAALPSTPSKEPQ